MRQGDRESGAQQQRWAGKQSSSQCEQLITLQEHSGQPRSDQEQIESRGPRAECSATTVPLVSEVYYALTRTIRELHVRNFNCLSLSDVLSLGI